MRWILIAFIFAIIGHSNAQIGVSEKIGKHQITADVLKPWFGNVVLTYEYLLPGNNSFGLRFGQFSTYRTPFLSFYLHEKRLGFSTELFYNFNYFQKYKERKVRLHSFGFFINCKNLDYQEVHETTKAKKVDEYHMNSISVGFLTGRKYIYYSGFTFGFFLGGGLSRCLNDFKSDDSAFLFFPNGFIVKAGLEVGFSF
ncbi:MAG: hypothetical protein KDC05_15305 [Bacteroidales bacterium]|nr:hypothetical protein [Bacteroidales bacterium]